MRPIPPQCVKPCVKRSKNDRNDAEATCEAAGRPGMHFVPVKTVTRQARGMALKVREGLIGQRTMLINASWRCRLADLLLPVPEAGNRP